MSKTIKIHKAFTLAEVLITLLIIGVVASIVIPSVLQDTQDAELKTAWKKAYSDLENGIKLVMLDNGGNIGSCIDTTGDSILPQLKNKFSYSRYSTLSNPIFGTSTDPAFNYKYLNKTNAGFGVFDDEQLILNNGMFIIANCTNCNGLSGHVIWVDVNGYLKGPNIIGKDIFGVKVYSTGIKPLGTTGDGYENTCSTSSTGWGCSAKYLYQ